MYYDIYINDIKRATVGPTDLEHLSISLSSVQGQAFLVATGLSGEPGKDQQHLTWTQEEVKPGDKVRIEPSKDRNPTDPKRTRRLRSGQKSTSGDIFCDFCKRDEVEVGRVIRAGDTPHICKDCADLCVEIFKGEGGDA